MVREIQRFEVSLKAFLVRDGRALFLREADSGFWELPGGRIDAGEEWEPHSAVLAREIREELGRSIVVRFDDRAVTWTRQREADGFFLFLIARRGSIISGEPVLSDEHSDAAWHDRESSAALAFPPSSGYRQAIHELWRLLD
jgi:8-oxo-dGTP pyrophosphatase MutT (NUDIX family)